MSEKQKMECACCDEEIDDSNANYVEGIGDVCSECYYENTTECCLCGERISDKEKSRYVLIKAEFAASATRLPGIYRITSRPFMSVPLIGSACLWGDSILFIDRLPALDHTYDLSGHICKQCALPHARTCRIAYRNVGGKPSSHSGKWWNREVEHTNSVIAAHPEMLMDLEEDRHLDELRSIYHFPDGARTWHEYLALEYKGVKIYLPHRYSNGAWLTLRPDPRHRPISQGNPYVFDASSLPTFDMKAAMERSRSYDDSLTLELAAIRSGIDAGAITQDAIAPNDSPLWKNSQSLPS